MKAHRVLVVGVLVIFFCLMTGCKDKESIYKSDDKLGYLAYDEFQDDNNLIYIEENDGYQPYIVLTNDYDGKTLLLRKYLLDDFIRMNEYYAKYEDCEMDTYVNNQFYNTLSPEILGKIQDTKIVVTHQAWDGRNDNGIVYSINRKVFLLSCSELGFTMKYVIQKEGKSLKYFEKDENWVAYLENDNTKSYPWWLRTNYINTESCFNFVSGNIDISLVDGKIVEEVKSPIIASTNAFDTNGIRPAFCLASNLEIEKNEKAIDGQLVYVLKN